MNLAEIVTASLISMSFVSGLKAADTGALGLLMETTGGAQVDVTMPPHQPETAMELSGTEQLGVAVYLSDIKEMRDQKRYFWLQEYPASSGADPEKILSDMTDCHCPNGTGIMSMFKVYEGAESVKHQSAEWHNEASELASESKTASAQIYRDVAEAMEKAFIGNRDFSLVMVAAHDAEGNGDTEYRAILAKRTDGSWLLLGYSSLPI